MNEIVNWLNDVLWGNLLIYLLLGTGVLFTVRTKFIQFRHFGHMFSVMKSSRKGDASGISSFQALCTSLAARVGTGNLAGVALAISLGGPGAVFWMWVVALLGMATSFAESSLAQLYKIKDSDGNFRGGPSYYMEQGLGKRWMGVIFAICLIVAFGLVFNAVQANSIASALHEAFGFEKYVVGGILVAAAALIIFGGIRSIARFAELVVPIMALAYVLVALVVVLMNIQQMPEVFSLIFRSAFGFQEAGAGALGAAMMNGIKRGLFSNEAGMGSAPNAAATATPYPPHPASQGYVQMLGVFIDTLVICTATAAIILLSYNEQLTGDGIALTQQALSGQVGEWGSYFVGVAIIFFAFTSIVGNYSYAETNLIFLEHNHKAGLWIFRLLVLSMVMFGAVVKIDIIWNLADVSMGFMAIVNLVAILMLSGVVVKLAKDYNRQLDAGKVPTFNSDDYPELKQQIDPEIWSSSKK
ncbi:MULTISPECIES: alanine/glycine:cation symporter family protein [unclassified Agarivorans]|uniref:alanine/glycine:cation symporter family protein n=1 Tax=unclassified Agarivorans TaxID=2636026 RepID=UPI0026E1D847|nr:MULTISPECIES: sodium:alanine symporter family protein [unclassified Agarivorans]MDO6686980.1 sodium:alanine symporter family protein [Agarivorans sp. 3_MG-2023]MDO6716777.1 sodium:alanine symporter family protein [Agarivorans sp. 2_MG-2023]MDO6764484.1 sodium:alanine symporter family protein [Agarivorans sp. 1_MG-2023]